MSTLNPLKDQKLSRITELATGIAQNMGLSVLDVRFSQQGRRRSLEVCIFRKGGEAIGLSDCENVSRALEQALENETQDSESLVPGSFLLEVVSPGIERQLTTAREFQLFSGSRVRVKTKENISDLGNDFVCLLLGGDHSHLELSQARALTDPKQKVSKGKAAKKKAKPSQVGEFSGCSTGEAFNLELARVFKVNLYSDDLKKETKSPEC